jgi:gluconokinase
MLVSTGTSASARDDPRMPATPRAIVVMGVAGSGKTAVAQALARHYGFAFLDADEFHSAEARARMAAGIPLTDVEREPWVEALVETLQRRARAGDSVVLAYSGLRAAHRQRLRESGMPLHFVFLHAPPHVIAARLAARTHHFMPPALFASQLRALEVPTGEADVLAVDAAPPLGAVVADAIAALEAADERS